MKPENGLRILEFNKHQFYRPQFLKIFEGIERNACELTSQKFQFRIFLIGIFSHQLMSTVLPVGKASF